MGQVLVIPVGYELHRPHQARILTAHRLLQVQRKPQVLLLVGMLKAARVASDEYHDLGGANAVLIGLGLIGDLIRAQSVPVQVDDDPDTGIIGKISLNGLAAPVIRAGVAGIIVNSRIMYHVQTVALKYLRELVAYPYYIIISIQRAIGAQILVFIQSGRGVGLACLLYTSPSPRD